MDPSSAHLQQPVAAYARTDFPLLRVEMDVEAALRVIREKGIGERIVYFYVVEANDRLAGVLPTRRLLAAQTNTPLTELMIRRVVAIPQSATLLDACDIFVLHKFFALPVVDENRCVVGVIDIGVFTQEVLDMEEPEKVDNVFEALGFHISQVRGASPFKAFQYRFPWLLTTIGSGTAGALLAGAFEKTLSRALVVAFFLALVLALAESVSIQSMTLTLQTLRTSRPTLRWFARTAKRELLSALLLGIGCGTVVFLIVWVWQRALNSALVIGFSVAGSVVIACLAGLGMPSLLHALKWDPKIAAGPVTLAVTDVATLLLYFSLAAWIL
ncbi:MAG: domain containing protein [Chthoniobacteraceae bacterium]|nr:domain containing protein [Chthoniobacteraceae bacterium]